MKVKIGATIPTVQYGNLMPEFEADADTYEAALAQVMPQIEGLWARYAEPGKELRRNETRQKLQAFVGGGIYYDDATHTYTNEAGEVYESGSQFAAQFEQPFDQASISQAMAKKYGVSAEDIIKLWECKAEISKGLGTALHAAMEMFGRYDELARKMDRSALHDNPMVMEAVRLFFAEHEGENALYEVVVADHAKKRAGRIDRLVAGKDGAYAIEDFKTDVNIQKKLLIYQKQLSFYAAILEAAGRVVATLRVHHWNGVEWQTHQLTKEQV